jgi:serine/threonine-protein kinase HipA
MRELNLPYPDAEQLFRRMVFNVLAKNCVDHTKNFAFRLKKDSNWELAPAYDICYAYRPGSNWVSQHALSINGKRTNIKHNDLLAIGKSIKNKKAADVIDEISNTISLWKTFADEVKVSPKLRDEIDKTLIKTL